MADYIQNKKGESALDVGTGSGFLAAILSENFNLVVSTDISLDALAMARKKVVNCICCNGADAINCYFDLVVCNLPYLPSDELEDPAVDGLSEGLGIPTNIVKSANNVIKKNGKMVYLTSSLANYKELMRRTEKLGFSTKIVSKRKLFFEELILVECTKL